MPLPATANDLIAHWQRHDWRESFFAPALQVLQALTTDGQTASGAGRSRDEALTRCLGETAEILALTDGVRKDFIGNSDGIAAHPDPLEARFGAICEAYERRAIWRWWCGEAEARPVAADWLDGAGLVARLDLLRRGASLGRRSNWWHVNDREGPCVMICCSTSLEGQDPILGFGAAPNAAAAAEKAMREMLLMELNLMERMASRITGKPASGLDLYFANLSRRLPQLLPATPPAAPQDQALPDEDSGRGRNYGMRDLTPRDGPFAVWLCQLAEAGPRLTAEASSPYC